MALLSSMLDEMTLLGISTPEPIIVTPQNRDHLLSGTPFFFTLICKLTARIKHGALTFVLPDGRVLKFVGQDETSSEGVIIVRDFAFARRALLGGDIGFFESFADDEWDTPSVADCLYVFARNADYVQDAFSKAPLIEWANNLRRVLRKNTKAGARKNIMAHYDLGNAFYEAWLDPSMTYSSAVFPSESCDLKAAQQNKYKQLAQSIGLRSGETVLEIGSGWGGFAEYAAREVGAKVTGVTISQAQLDYAMQRIQREGLNDKVELRLQDYRDIDGQFDKIASIEMFEAVGAEYWPAYFDKIRDSLKPGGVAGLQIITIADRFFDTYKRSTDFIQRYVFPGGMLPSQSVLKEQFNRAGLAWTQAASYGQHYARTLSEWHDRFLNAWEDIEPMGFDRRFRKLWRFYLGYCEAGFRAGTTDVLQIAARKI